ncbi:MAG: thioredoxin family protein [Pirellulales bacterium]|nr:thioredoxin family protein [Pirellulales bacterium]
MNKMILLALMQVSATAADQVTFEQAYQQSLTTGRPLVVLIGAVWCPGCNTMKNSVMPQVAKAGGLEKVVFFYVDYDQQRQLASRLKRATSIPQLIRFDKTPAGWKSQCLVGAKNPREVFQFINAGLIEKKKEVREISATHPSLDNVREPSADMASVSETTGSPPQTTSSVTNTPRPNAKSF